MRIPALAILMIATVLTAAPARAQTYDPTYPICLHKYGPATYYECRYTSLPQCNVSASGRAARCVINPYFARAQVPPDYRRHRRVTQAYYPRNPVLRLPSQCVLIRPVQALT
jgi:hypothetical protein